MAFEIVQAHTNKLIKGYALNIVDGLIGYLITSYVEYYKKSLSRGFAFPIAVLKTALNVKPINIELDITSYNKTRIKLITPALYFYAINTHRAGSGFRLANNQSSFNDYFSLGVFQWSNIKRIPILVTKALYSKFLIEALMTKNYSE